MIITTCTVASRKISKKKIFAMLADLHNGPYEEALPLIREADAVLFAGDLVDRHHPGLQHVERFLREVPEMKPTYFVPGNHEWKYKDPEPFRHLLNTSRIHVLRNRFVGLDGIVLGGFEAAETPDPAFLRHMEKQEGFKLLLCHHPEYYPRYIQDRDIDLTFSGHAHGGQIRIFGQGMFAPGQGLFPRLTSGFYDNGRLLVSRGMTHADWAPRLWNPTEVIRLELVPEA